jgi:hypothetical protein
MGADSTIECLPERHGRSQKPQVGSRENSFCRDVPTSRRAGKRDFRGRSISTYLEDSHLVETPLRNRPRTPPAKFSSKQWPKFQNQSSHRSRTDIRTALGEQIFRVALPKGETKIKPRHDRGGNWWRPPGLPSFAILKHIPCRETGQTPNDFRNHPNLLPSTHHARWKKASDQCIPQSALVMMAGGTIGESK